MIVPPAAYLACTNTGAGSDMNIFLVVVFATLGALVGAFINYYLALWIGRPGGLPLRRQPTGTRLSHRQGESGESGKYFDRHGAVSTFVGRLIPAIRQLISIPAGISRMNVAQFAIFTSLGALVWNAILAFLGYWLSPPRHPPTCSSTK